MDVRHGGRLVTRRCPYGRPIHRSQKQAERVAAAVTANGYFRVYKCHGHWHFADTTPRPRLPLDAPQSGA